MEGEGGREGGRVQPRPYLAILATALVVKGRRSLFSNNRFSAPRTSLMISVKYTGPPRAKQ